MWDNMGLKKKDENVASYQMAAVTMDRLGIHEGNIFRYHQARRNTRNYQVDLETLQYDILYGEEYAVSYTHLQTLYSPFLLLRKGPENTRKNTPSSVFGMSVSGPQRTLGNSPL